MVYSPTYISIFFLFFQLVFIFRATDSIGCKKCVVEKCPNVSCTGSTYKDFCHCCDICSKQVGMRCGGPWNIFGKCEPGLICRRNITNPRDVEIKPGVCTDPTSERNQCGNYGCAPLCSPTYCRGSDSSSRICSTNGFLRDEEQNIYPIAEVIRPCQGSCQKTTCGACHLIRKPICETCRCDSDSACFVNYSKCMRAHRCRGNLNRGINCNYNSKKNTNSNSFYIFKCMVPPCPSL